jgi:hypothetical protein
MIEWLRICARHGWLPGHTRSYREPVKRLRKAGKAAVDKLAAARRDAGLHVPYGRAAVPPASPPPACHPPGAERRSLTSRSAAAAAASACLPASPPRDAGSRRGAPLRRRGRRTASERPRNELRRP